MQEIYDIKYKNDIIVTWKPEKFNHISQEQKSQILYYNNSKVTKQRLLNVESMKCPSAKKRGSVEMQCNLIHAYIIPVL